MGYLIAQMLLSLLVAAALGALVGWLAKGALVARREDVWRRELRRSESRAGNLKNQLAEASLVEGRLREELQALKEVGTRSTADGAAADAPAAAAPEAIEQLQAELARRDQKIEVLKLQVRQSEAAVASEWQSLKAVKSEITERQQRLLERGKRASTRLKDSEEKQQQLRLGMRSLKRRSERLQEELKASQRALANERRNSGARRARLEAKLAALAAERLAAERLAAERLAAERVPEPIEPAPGSREEPEAAVESTAGEEPAEDDLRRIRGIGPVLYRKLKDAGVTTFRQIAAWSDDDVAEVASKIGMSPGRIRKGGWVEKAGELLRG